MGASSTVGEGGEGTTMPAGRYFQSGSCAVKTGLIVLSVSNLKEDQAPQKKTITEQRFNVAVFPHCEPLER